ncbi:putative ABC transporter permease [Lacticaseibacillus suibinensis]|uniref:putative ABC transporter permease n=1 Tax=Lacticaseibacillus suibinensis TaxID=2486011 RepID=UPI000F7B26CF|nr:putative ABC transporter permease [Lacticaseibacillus suibinensis]
MTATEFEQTFTLWVLYFFAYAFVGWLWESGYVSVKKRQWTNSGFLAGPVIPVYGFSITAVLALVQPFAHNLVLLYLLSALVITVIEYVTSWLMEKLFHARWWDYSKIPLNLNGRVALPISAFWGVGVVLVIKFVHPVVAHFVTRLDVRYGIFAAIVMLALFMFDFGFSLANVLAFGAATKRIGDAIDTKKQELITQVDTATAKLSQDEPRWLADYRRNQGAQATLPKLSWSQRRWLKSFPHLHLNDTQTSAKDISALAELLKKARK